ncbi:MAG: hypothetical protein M1839_006254 [Geoglossum umbratile]|nr:MAG: hypothetical protein M1839_006254 [Geoglossum umbratile]
MKSDSLDSMALYSVPSKEARFVGKSLHELPMPAAIIDVAALTRNCDRIVRAADEMGFEFRPHVGAHKTTELTRLQMGRDIEGTPEKTLAVSNIADLEGLISFLKSYEKNEPTADIFYDSPLPQSQVPRLIAVQGELGASALSILVDHKDQLLALKGFTDAGLPWPRLFIKLGITHSSNGAGVGAQSDELKDLLDVITDAEKTQSQVLLRGFYYRGSANYDEDTGTKVLESLLEDIVNAVKAARFTRTATGQLKRPFILSVGNTPAANSIRTALSGGNADLTLAATSIRGVLAIANGEGLRVELCAAAYPFLDTLQLCLNMSSPKGSGPCRDLPCSDIALTVLTEVTGIYPSPHRDTVAVAVGTTILGHEADKFYEAYGMLTGWNIRGQKHVADTSRDGDRWWNYSKARECGIFSRDKGSGELVVGQRVRIVPGQGSQVGRELGRYFVVDSERKGKEDEVVDIWVRWKSW